MFEAVIYGLVDAVNPCLLFTLSFLVFVIFKLAKNGYNVSKYVSVFIAVSFISLLLFSSNVLMQILYAPWFTETGRFFYIFAGTLSVGWGIVHLLDWWGLTKQEKKHTTIAAILAGPYERGRRSVKIMVILVLAAVVLAGFSTLWPPSQYILISSLYLSMPGKTLEVLIMLLIYNFMLVVPLLGVFILVESDAFSRWVRQAPSMVKMVLSALLIASGSSLIYIFQ